MDDSRHLLRTYTQLARDRKWVDKSVLFEQVAWVGVGLCFAPIITQEE